MIAVPVEIVINGAVQTNFTQDQRSELVLFSPFNGCTLLHTESYAPVRENCKSPHRDAIVGVVVSFPSAENEHLFTQVYRQQ